MAFSREGAGSPFPQGEAEELAYEFDFTPWVITSAPTNPSVKLFDTLNNDTDVSGSKLSGAPSISSNVVTTPLVIDLVQGAEYRLTVNVTLDGNKEEAFIILIGEP
jgi:hypothetical protein